MIAEDNKMVASFFGDDCVNKGCAIILANTSIDDSDSDDDIA
jgi:hypothetical protein